MSKATIRATWTFPHPPERVWRALADPARLSRWLMPSDLRAEVGAVGTFDAGPWGEVTCEVLEVVPPTRLVWTWRNPPLDTVVTWTLTPHADGTTVVLEHAGFDLDDPMQRMAYDGMGGGWTAAIPERLRALLASDDGAA